jgi:hypothetical protein
VERESLIELDNGVQSQLENSLLGIWSEVLRSSSTQRADASAAFEPLGGLHSACPSGSQNSAGAEFRRIGGNGDRPSNCRRTCACRYAMRSRYRRLMSTSDRPAQEPEASPNFFVDRGGLVEGFIIAQNMTYGFPVVLSYSLEEHEGELRSIAPERVRAGHCRPEGA